MAANPWDKFFWNDWENDPALKLCSLAAQGLWMRCLCICAKAEPKGYLLVAGRRLSPVDLATLVGRPETEVETLLNELASAGVFSRDRQGRIYSRRMVRDENKRAIARKNGKEGGNPTLLKERGNSASDNPPLKGEDNTHKPEAKSQRPELEKDRGADAPPAYAFVGRVIRLNRDDFERWRTTYSAVPDFVAALQAADDYYGQNPPKDGKWFFPVSRWLEKAHKDELEKRRQRTQPFQRYAL